MPNARRGGAAGFTLLEMLAVVAVIALMLGLVLPTLGVTRGAKLQGQARSLAAVLEHARQRAAVTGAPHQLVVDLDNAGYWLEWLASDEPAVPATAPAELDLSGETPIPLAPPRDETLSYRPVPSQFGRAEWLDEALFFEGVDTPEGWFQEGVVAVAFRPDGSSDGAEIAIADEDGRAIFLQVRPYLDAVRIHHDEPR